jgi:hypothetical protein
MGTSWALASSKACLDADKLFVGIFGEWVVGAVGVFNETQGS